MSHKKFPALISLMILGLASITKADLKSACQERLAPDRALQKEKEGSTTVAAKTSARHFLNYLENLLYHQVISYQHLEDFINHLRLGLITNPIRQEEALTQSASLIHQKRIDDFIDQAHLTPDELLKFSLDLSRRWKIIEARHQGVSEQTKEVREAIRFHTVPLGSFRRRKGQGGEGEPVNLDHSIEVMQTPVTQWQWAQLMGKNPAEFTDGEYARMVDIKGEMMNMQPNHPIEQVSWWSVLVFANRFSQQMGLPPAYDLSDIYWKPGTTGEYGNLAFKSGKLRVNSSREDYYQTQGYRLPTEAEREYLLNGSGKVRQKFHLVDREADLKTHAWYAENSGGRTHPVAQLNPLVIGGSRVYDLMGNVWEWCWDGYGSDTEAGLNPGGSAFGHQRVIHGGSAFSLSFQFMVTERLSFAAQPNYGFKDVGFRLVRTIHP